MKKYKVGYVVKMTGFPNLEYEEEMESMLSKHNVIKIFRKKIKREIQKESAEYAKDLDCFHVNVVIFKCDEIKA